MAVDFALLGAVLLRQPHALDVGALGDEVPLLIRLPRVRLWRGEEVGLGKLARELGLDHVPDGLVLGRPLAEERPEVRHGRVEDPLGGLLPRKGAEGPLLGRGDGGGEAQEGQAVNGLHGEQDIAIQPAASSKDSS